MAQAGSRATVLRVRLDEAVPDDHLVRKIGALLDLSWVYAELAPYYSKIGRRRLRCRAFAKKRLT